MLWYLRVSALYYARPMAAKQSHWAKPKPLVQTYSVIKHVQKHITITPYVSPLSESTSIFRCNKNYGNGGTKLLVITELKY